jgi:hypothetical protein
MSKINNELFKKILILFWALWWLIASWTDITGGLAHLGTLSATWAPDTNYPFLVNTLKLYSVPSWLPPLLFVGIIFWSLVAAFTFCWTCLSLHKSRDIWMKRAQIAFIVSISFWLAFFLADQMVFKFDLEQNHMVQGGFELLCFLAIYVLP